VWPTCRGLSSYRAKILAHLTLPDRIVTPATRRPGRRPLVVGAILAVAVVLVLLGGLLAWQPAVFLRAGLWLAGHEEVSFDQLRVGLRRLELRGLAVGGRSRPEQLVGRLTIDYRPGDLLRGRIEAVSVEGVTLRGHVGPDGLRLEGMDLAAAESGEAARLPALPLPERVAIRDVRLELATPAGVVTVPSRRSSTRSRIAPRSCSTPRPRSWPRRPDGCERTCTSRARCRSIGAGLPVRSRRPVARSCAPRR
jgi:hypothetical protein